MSRLSRDPVLEGLIARMRQPISVRDIAGEEALRIIVRYGLRHPMTLAAAMKVAAGEMPHGRMGEIEATARALHARLLRHHEEPEMPQ